MALVANNESVQEVSSQMACDIGLRLHIKDSLSGLPLKTFVPKSLVSARAW